MRKKHNFISALFFSLTIIFFSSSTHAQNSAGFKLGTLGAGVELTLPLSAYVGTRFNLNYFSYEFETEREGVDYDVPVELKTFATLVDVHPFRGIFRITAGLLVNQNNVELSASGEETISLGDIDYQGEYKLEGELFFRKMAPYLGIGWSPPLHSKSRWGLSADIGVMFHGTPRIKANASGTATNTETGETIDDVSTDGDFLNDLNNEVREIQEDIDDFSFSGLYPVASISFIFKF